MPSEKTLITKAHGTVTLEPTLYPQEIPGLVRLDQPLTIRIEKKDIQLSEVELWSRCFPAGLIVRIGDKLIIDVNYDTREKIFFARNILIQNFRKIGREHGIVSWMRDGVGFIRSNVRNSDIVFRLSEVIDLNGNMIVESDVIVGLSVSYEVVIDESSRSNDNRLRAIRIRVASIGENTSNDTHHQQHSNGRVTRSNRNVVATTGDSPNDGVSDAVTEGLRDFLQQPLLQDVTIENLTSHQRREYYVALEKQFPGLSMEMLPSSNGNIASIKLHKLTASEVATKASSNNFMNKLIANNHNKILKNNNNVEEINNKNQTSNKAVGPVTPDAKSNNNTSHKVTSKDTVHNSSLSAKGGSTPNLTTSPSTSSPVTSSISSIHDGHSRATGSSQVEKKNATTDSEKVETRTKDSSTKNEATMTLQKLLSCSPAQTKQTKNNQSEAASHSPAETPKSSSSSAQTPPNYSPGESKVKPTPQVQTGKATKSNNVNNNKNEKSSELEQWIKDGTAQWEEGHIEVLKHNHGFIRSADRLDCQVYFKFSDIINPPSKISEVR